MPIQYLSGQPNIYKLPNTGQPDIHPIPNPVQPSRSVSLVGPQAYAEEATRSDRLAGPHDHANSAKSYYGCPSERAWVESVIE